MQYTERYPVHVIVEGDIFLLYANASHGIAGRVGGMEFAVFCNDLIESEVLEEAERFRKLIEAHSFRLRNGPHITITVSG
jgi:GGDEF domain-containing protein